MKYLISIVLIFIIKSQDSIPSYNVVYSKVYNSIFSNENTHFDIELLQRENALLHQYIKKYLKTALDIIPIYSGYKWKENYHINIYPSRSEKSFSHPLTLMDHSNKQFLFFNLIHEVIHHNIDENLFINKKMYEAYCDKVAKKVISFLPGTFRNAYKLSIYYPEQKLYRWSIDTLTVEEWIKNNKTKYDKSYLNFQRLSTAILHKNEKNLSHYLEELTKSGHDDLIERSYFELISYYRDIASYKKSLSFIEAYRKRYQTGTFTENVLFISSELYQRENEEDKYLVTLDSLKKRSYDINNYLDDAYLSTAKYHHVNGDNGKALEQLFYLVETLPMGKSRYEAYKSIGRIFAREEKYLLSELAYHNAIRFCDTNEKKAQVIFEMSDFISDGKKADLKKVMLRILADSLKPDLEKRLEKIYFDLFK